MRRFIRGLFYFLCIVGLELSILHGRLWLPEKLPVLPDWALPIPAMLLVVASLCCAKALIEDIVEP